MRINSGARLWAVVGVSMLTLTTGMLGAASAAPVLVPDPVSGGVEGGTVVTIAAVPSLKYSQIDAGGNLTVAIDQDGAVWSWGSYDVGTAGVPQVRQPVPVQVAGLTDITQVSGGGYHSLALAADGSVWAWGDNRAGALGDGTRTASAVPIKVEGLPRVIQVSAGLYSSAAVDESGQVWTWGFNDGGQLGDGTTDLRLVPGLVSGVSGATQVAIGMGHTMALTADGAVWYWGGKMVGQYNYSPTSWVPIQLAGLPPVAQVEAHQNKSMVLDRDGHVWSWGSNSLGNFGDGTTTNSNTPVQAQGLDGVTSIALTSVASMALDATGTLWTWGSNRNRMLGDDTYDQRLLPAQITSVGPMTQVVGGDYHAAILGAHGQILSWGNGISGQLGNGSTSQLGASFVPPRPGWAVTGATFGAVAGSAASLTDGVLTVTTPAHAAGPVDVVLTTTTSTGTARQTYPAGTFTYTAAPQVTRHPQDVTVQAGDPATFTAATSDSAASVRWQRADGTNWVDIPGATASPLVIAPSAVVDGDVVRAVFTNEYGQTPTNSASVTVSAALVLNIVGDTFTVPVSRASDLDVLGNDVGTGLVLQSASVNTGGGTAEVIDGLVRFTPAADASTGSLTYTVRDYVGTTADATVTLMVQSAPVAGDLTVEVASGAHVEVDALAEVTGTNLVLSSVSAPPQGTVEIIDQKIVFDAPDGPQTITVNYTVADDFEQASTGTLTLVVAPVASPTTPTGSSATGTDVPPAVASAPTVTTAPPGNGLANTGASAAGLALTSALLLGLGAVAVVRRRRITHGVR